MTRPAMRDTVVNQRGESSRHLRHWNQDLADRPIRTLVDASATLSAPSMKKDETIILKATGIGKTFLVHYDGTSRYYWETSGTDLY